MRAEILHQNFGIDGFIRLREDARIEHEFLEAEAGDKRDQTFRVLTDLLDAKRVSVTEVTDDAVPVVAAFMASLLLANHFRGFLDAEFELADRLDLSGFVEFEVRLGDFKEGEEPLVLGVGLRFELHHMHVAAVVKEL